MLGEASRARIEAAAQALETKTDAELLLVLAESSGSYRDADHLGGALLAALALTGLLMGHFHGTSVPEDWIPPLTLVAYVGGFLLARAPFARRMLTLEARRSRQVREAARVAFVEEGAGSTRKRDGVVLYLSAFERKAEVVPDLGVEAKLESASWHAIARDLTEAARKGDLEAALVRAVESAGEKLARALPKTAGDSREIGKRLVVKT